MSILIKSKSNFFETDIENLQRFISEIASQNIIRTSRAFDSQKKCEIAKNVIYKLFRYLNATGQRESKLKDKYLRAGPIRLLFLT